MIDNICHFIPYHEDYHSIHTINFVFETKPQIFSSLKSESVYKMHYVVSGNGFVHTRGKTQSICAGDVFFTFPSEPFCIESCDDFSYMYISFIGSRANMIMEKLKISPSKFLFKECSRLCDFWKNGLDTNTELTDLISESILLYSFSFLGSRTISFDNKNKSNSNAAMLIKKYIDDNFRNMEISLDSISKELLYNKKYISTIFKKNFGIGVVEYLNTIRIQYSCSLFEQGFTSVSDISLCCGYADPQYFSKVFKRKMGMYPKAYIQANKKDF